MFGTTRLRRQASPAVLLLAPSHPMRHPLVDESCFRVFAAAEATTSTAAAPLPVPSALAAQHLRAFRAALPALFPRQATDQFGPLLIDRADPSVLESLMRHVLRTGGNVQHLSFVRVTTANREELHRGDSSWFRSAAMRRAGSVTVAVRCTQFLYLDTQLHGMQRLVEAMRLATADLHRVVGVSASHRVWEGADRGWRMVVETPESIALSVAEATIESTAQGQTTEPPALTTPSATTPAPLRLWVKPRRVPGLHVLCAKSRATLVSSSQQVELFHTEQLAIPSAGRRSFDFGSRDVHKSDAAGRSRHYWGLTGAPVSLPWKRGLGCATPGARERGKESGESNDARGCNERGDSSQRPNRQDGIDSLSALEDALLLRLQGESGDAGAAGGGEGNRRCHHGNASHHCWFRASELGFLHLAPLPRAAPLRVRSHSTFVCVPLLSGAAGMHADAIASLFRIFPLPLRPLEPATAPPMRCCFLLECSTRSWRRVALSECTFNFGHTTSAELEDAFATENVAKGGGSDDASSRGCSEVTLIELRFAVELGLVASVSGASTTVSCTAVRVPSTAVDPPQRCPRRSSSSKCRGDRRRDAPTRASDEDSENESTSSTDATSSAWGTSRIPGLRSVLSAATHLPESVIRGLRIRDNAVDVATDEPPTGVIGGEADSLCEHHTGGEEMCLRYDLLNIMLVECVESADVYHATWVAPKTLVNYTG